MSRPTSELEGVQLSITLRIKKYWFDEIEAGRKWTEYRKDSTFYRRLLGRSGPVSWLMLHYQKGPKLLCSVVAIRFVDTPAEHLELLGTAKCWAIDFDGFCRLDQVLPLVRARG